MKFSSLTIAARLALEPQQSQPADTDPGQSAAAMGSMMQALLGPKNDDGENHEKTGKGRVSSTPRAGEEIDALDDAAADEEAEDPGPVTMAGTTAEQRQQARKAKELREVIGERIRAAREVGAISQTDFARWIGKAGSAQLSLWEKGRRMPPITELPNIARALGVSIDYLMGLSEEPEHDVGVGRRTLLVGHLRDQLEAVVGHLADVALESGSAVEAALRSTRMLTMAGAMAKAVDRFKSANSDCFEDFPAGALLVRSAQELSDAASSVSAELDAVARRREFAALRMKEATAGGAR